VICVLLVATAAFGQTDIIFPSSNPVYLDCNLTDGSTDVITIYIIHEFTPGTAASRFRVAPGGGFGCIWLGDFSPFLMLGNSQNGISISYGACYQSPVLILEVRYLCTGISETCSWLTICPDLDALSGKIEAVDCHENLLFINGTTLWVNADPNLCGCALGGPTNPAVTCQGPVPVEDSSWGAIKSLYR